MIHYHALIDTDGWVTGTMLREGPTPPVQDDHVPLRPEEHAAAKHVLVGLRHGPEGMELAQDDREIWKAARHRPAGEHAPPLHHVLLAREARRVFTRDLTVAVPHPPPLHDPEAPVPHDFPEVPGLSLVAMSSSDLDAAADIAIGAGLYAATCPDGTCSPPEAHAWLELAARLDNWDQWQMVLTFNGAPLQYEIITFNQARTRATFAITYHATRERPSWFWRECERPVYEAMAGMGAMTIDSRTRSDRPDWIQSLKDNYGASQGRTAGGITKLLFPLDLRRFTGWPARITLGFDQTTAAVRTWEATAADLPALKQLITDAVPAPRRPIALRMVDEWWHLDRASILLGSKDGQLRYARALRLRKPGVAGLAHLGAMYDEPEQAQVTAHVRAWCRQAGYTTLSSFIPTRLMQSRNMQAQLARAGSHVKAERPDWREPFTEVETDV